MPQSPEPHFNWSGAVWGYHTGQHRTRTSQSSQKVLPGSTAQDALLMSQVPFLRHSSIPQVVVAHGTIQCLLLLY